MQCVFQHSVYAVEQEDQNLFKVQLWYDQAKWYYDYNASSRISEIEQHIEQGSSIDITKYEYSYDKLQRLTSVIHSVSPPSGGWDPPDQINSFTYDQFGNMLMNELEFPNDPGLDTQMIFDVNKQQAQ